MTKDDDALLREKKARSAQSRVVPLEPTQEMLDAAHKLSPPFGPPEKLTPDFCERWRASMVLSYTATWRAMYDAAPPPAARPDAPIPADVEAMAKTMDAVTGLGGRLDCKRAASMLRAQASEIAALRIEIDRLTTKETP